MCVESEWHKVVCISVRRAEQVLKLVVLDLARAIFVNVLNQLLNVNGHSEVLLDDSDESLGVDEALFVW